MCSSDLLRRYQRDVPQGEASQTLVMFRDRGIRSPYILDETSDSLGAILPQVDLTANTHYDVIAYQVPGSSTVDGFTVVYPLP